MRQGFQLKYKAFLYCCSLITETDKIKFINVTELQNYYKKSELIKSDDIMFTLHSN